MRSDALRVFATVALAAATGCAPSFAGLLRDRHYYEAGAAVRFQPDPVAARARLTSQLATDLAPAVHVHAITPTELRALGPNVALPTRSPDDRASAQVLARVSLETTLVAARPRVRLSVALRVGRSVLDAPAVLDWEQMVALFGERIAQPTTVAGTGSSDVERLAIGVYNAGAAAVAVGGVVFTLATLGIACLVAPVLCPGNVHELQPREPTVVPPTAADYAREAPRATLLVAAVRGLDTRARSSSWLIAIERPVDEATARLALVFSPSINDTPLPQVVVPLPAGPTLEARVAAAFGGRLRTLDELRAAR